MNVFVAQNFKFQKKEKIKQNNKPQNKKKFSKHLNLGLRISENKQKHTERFPPFACGGGCEGAVSHCTDPTSCHINVSEHSI